MMDTGSAHSKHGHRAWHGKVWHGGPTGMPSQQGSLASGTAPMHDRLVHQPHIRCLAALRRHCDVGVVALRHVGPWAAPASCSNAVVWVSIGVCLGLWHAEFPSALPSFRPYLSPLPQKPHSIRNLCVVAHVNRTSLHSHLPQTHFPPHFPLLLQDRIRNLCVMAHVDHGKTSLSDHLIGANGLIHPKLQVWGTCGWRCGGHVGGGVGSSPVMSLRRLTRSGRKDDQCAPPPLLP